MTTARMHRFVLAHLLTVVGEYRHQLHTELRNESPF